MTVEAETAQLSSTTAVALGAIIVELATNALKHAFRESMQGTIAIKFKAGGGLGQYVVEVEDDGIGIDPTKTADGFGTQIVTELARAFCEEPLRATRRAVGAIDRVRSSG